MFSGATRGRKGSQNSSDSSLGPNSTDTSVLLSYNRSNVTIELVVHFFLIREELIIIIPIFSIDVCCSKLICHN